MIKVRYFSTPEHCGTDRIVGHNNKKYGNAPPVEWVKSGLLFSTLGFTRWMLGSFSHFVIYLVI